MKMVSQLTRQAMSRHRLLSAVSCPDAPASRLPVSHSPSLQSLYKQEAAAPHPPSAPQVPPIAPIPVPQQRTIYGELMKKHDRFTERHLTGR